MRWYYSLSDVIKAAFPYQFPSKDITIFAGLAEFEREQMLQRQKEGIEIAKADGKYKGRQPIRVDTAHFEKEYKQWKSGKQTATAAMKALNMKPNTFYRRVKEYEQQQQSA